MVALAAQRKHADYYAEQSQMTVAGMKLREKTR